MPINCFDTVIRINTISDLKQIEGLKVIRQKSPNGKTYIYKKKLGGLGRIGIFLIALVAYLPSFFIYNSSVQKMRKQAFNGETTVKVIISKELTFSVIPKYESGQLTWIVQKQEESDTSENLEYQIIQAGISEDEARLKTLEEAGKLEHKGIKNVLGYNCYLSAVCQILARLPVYDPLLNVNIQQDQTVGNATTTRTHKKWHELIHLQLLFRNVVNQLRSNQSPTSQSIRLLEKQLTKMELLDSYGQQDATEVLAQMMSQFGWEPKEFDAKKIRMYEVQSQDCPPPKTIEAPYNAGKGNTRTRLNYAGGFEDKSNFSNVFLMENDSELNGKLCREEPSDEARYVSIPKSCDEEKVIKGFFKSLMHTHNFENPKEGNRVGTTKADTMRVIKIGGKGDFDKDDIFTHNAWTKKPEDEKKYSKMSSEELTKSLKENESFVVAQYQSDSQKWLRPPPFIPVAYKSGKKTLLEEDLTIDIAEFIEKDDEEEEDDLTINTEYELQGVIQRIGSGRNSGHYISWIKEGNKWTQYNDSSVSTHNQKNFMEKVKSSCYLLMYVQPEKLEEEG